VNSLSNNPLKKNFGVTGPLDINLKRHRDITILTQSFVHRTHYEIFGFLYPWIFKNWYSDDWMTYIYSPWNSTFIRNDIEVDNSQITGTRYHTCFFPGKSELKNMLDNYCIHLNNWLKGSNINEMILFPFLND
jgi:hypothetical protein